MESHDFLEHAFRKARARAFAYAEKYNSELPTEKCPMCADRGHVPGLRCPACGYKHHVAWSIVRDSEWGYEVIALTDRRKILAVFEVETDSNYER